MSTGDAGDEVSLEESMPRTSL